MLVKNIVFITQFDAKFIPQQIRFLLREFTLANQYFYVDGAPAKYYNEGVSAVKSLTFSNLPCFISQCYRADRIVLNGGFNPRVMVALATLPKILEKIVWLPWGGDLYWDKPNRRTFKSESVRLVRHFFFKGIYGVATPTFGDYQRAKEWYCPKAKYFDSGPNIFPFEKTDLDEIPKQIDRGKEIRVQVGNSGTPPNDHLQIFEILSKHQRRNLKVFAPLVATEMYAPYVKTVIEKGHEIFSDQFFSQLELIPILEYLKHLKSLDILILNHRRQQGFGNVVICLYFGVKVFIRRDVSIWAYLRDKLHCHLFDSSTLDGTGSELLEPINQEQKNHNRESIAPLFDRKWQRTMWERIYHV